LSDKLTPAGSIIGGIATAAALIFIAIQTNVTNTQFEEKDRPWIGIPHIIDPANSTIRFQLKNFGSVPTLDGTVSIKLENKLITKDSLYDTTSITDTLGVLLPDQDKYEDYFTTKNITQLIKNKTPLYLGVLIKYDYGKDNHGEYGLIGNYSTNINNFYYVNTWAK
jgi:hypothetical protein